MDDRTAYLRALHQWQTFDCEVRDAWRDYVEVPTAEKMVTIERLEKFADRAHSDLERIVDRAMKRPGA